MAAHTSASLVICSLFFFKHAEKHSEAKLARALCRLKQTFFLLLLLTSPGDSPDHNHSFGPAKSGTYITHVYHRHTHTHSLSTVFLKKHTQQFHPSPTLTPQRLPKILLLFLVHSLTLRRWCWCVAMRLARYFFKFLFFLRACMSKDATLARGEIVKVACGGGKWHHAWEECARKPSHATGFRRRPRTCLDVYFLQKVVKYDLRLETITVILTGRPSDYRVGLFKFRSR